MGEPFLRCGHLDDRTVYSVWGVWDDDWVMKEARTDERKTTDEELSQWVADYGDRLLRAAYWYCRNPVDAQDLVQETFVIAVKSADRFERRSAVYTWLYGILRNVGRHYLRKKKPMVPIESVEHMLEVESNPDQIDLNMATEKVEEVMGGLSAEHREVMVLRYQDGLKVRDIADALGITSGTVKSRLHYARDAIRRNLPPDLNLFVPVGT